MNDTELIEGISKIIFENENMTAGVFDSYEAYVKAGGLSNYNETSELILKFIKENLT